MSVYAYCKKNLYKQRIGIKGDNRPGVPLISKLSRDRKGYNLPLQFLGVNDGKQQVMTRLGLEQAGQQYFHFPVDDNHVGQRGYDQMYFKGIIAEQRKVRRRGGMIQVVWETISKDIRNEPLDLRVYNLACMKSLLPHINWIRLADMLGVEIPEEEQEKVQRKTAKRKKRPPQAKSRSMNLY